MKIPSSFQNTFIMIKSGSISVFRNLLIVAVSLFAFNCGETTHNKTELVVWGMSEGEFMIGTYAAIDAFEQTHPDIKIITSPAGRNGGPQKLMTAIVGGVPPDVMFQDRFTIGGWASHDAFMPLNSFIQSDANSSTKLIPNDFYSSTWNEATYKGKVYAIPYDVDVRVLYYNKTILRNAGFVDSQGKVIPPKTWSDLYRYNKKLTIINNHGGFERVGLIPLYGPATFYLFAVQNGGKLLSEDGKTCTMTDPKIVEALSWLTHYYDAMGGRDKVEGFMHSFLSDANDPFFTGQVAMTLNGNWDLGDIARYEPGMDFGVIPAPVPAGKKYVTWSGGFSLAIPAGAKHPKLAWEFIKWMSSPAAWEIRNRVMQQYYHSRGGLYVPGLSANGKVNQMVWEEFVENNPDLADKYKEGLRTCIDMLPNSRFRAVSPVAEKLWDQLQRATSYATYHVLSPEKALQQSQQVVQSELNSINNEKNIGYEVNYWTLSLYILLLLLLISIGFVVWKTRQIYVGSLTRRSLFAGIFFISPWIIGFLVFLAIPIIASIILSFTQYDVLHSARWVAMKNYTNLFSNDSLFWKSLLNTAFMLIEVPLSLSIGLAIALLLNSKAKGIAVYRTLYYLPSVVPLVAMSILWMWLLQPSSGFVNETLRLFGIHGPTWFSSPVWSKPAIIFMNLWTAGGGMIIWLAGLQGIPEVLYEAAEIDGAGRWNKFIHITLPMLTPYIFFNFIMGMIGSFQIFTSAYIITNGDGGPVDSTLFYVFYLFNNAFRYFKMGYASAMAWVLFIIILIFTLVQIWLSKKWVYYEENK